MVGELEKYNSQKGVGILSTFNEQKYYCYGYDLKKHHLYKFYPDPMDDEVARDLKEITMPFKIRQYTLFETFLSLLVALILGAIMAIFMVRMVHAEELSQEDVTLLAQAVHSEAGNQSLLGKRLVADVILNRVEHGDFPDTIHGVLHQPGQFQVVSNGTIHSLKADETDYLAVELELKNRTSNKVLFFRTKKYSKYGNPHYQIGDHYFS